LVLYHAYTHARAHTHTRIHTHTQLGNRDAKAVSIAVEGCYGFLNVIRDANKVSLAHTCPLTYTQSRTHAHVTHTHTHMSLSHIHMSMSLAKINAKSHQLSDFLKSKREDAAKFRFQIGLRVCIYVCVCDVCVCDMYLYVCVYVCVQLCV